MASPHLNNVHYPHRINSDGTMDSICPHCYITIGTSTWESDLERIEAAHACNPDRLRYFKQKKPQSTSDGIPKVVRMQCRAQLLKASVRN